MGYSKLVTRLAVSATVLLLIACAHGSSSTSSTTSSTTTTTTTQTPTSLVPTAAGTYAGAAVVLNVVQGPASLTASSAGSPTSDILTVMTPTAGNTGETFILSSTALAGGIPISLTSQGSATQSGLNSQSYQGSLTSAGTTYNFTLNDVSAAANLSYSSFGQWNVGPSGGANTSAGFYGVGSPTPTASVPTTGSANYTGAAIGVAVLNQSTTGYLFNGIATLSAIFSSNTITGSISNINAYSQTNTPVGTLNSINFTAGTISGNGFGGTASTSSTAGNAADISGATGAFRGNFFGPAAQEAGGTFSLTNSTSNAMISGSFGTHK